MAWPIGGLLVLCTNSLELHYFLLHPYLHACRCHIQMNERRSDVTDGFSWYCPTCKTTKSVRADSFFAKSRKTLQQWLLMILNWALETPVTVALEQAKIDVRSACDVYQWLRELCTTTLLNTPIILGGPGVVVQVDESLFCHKPKV